MKYLILITAFFALTACTTTPAPKAPTCNQAELDAEYQASGTYEIQCEELEEL